MTIRDATTPAELAAIRRLFEEYVAWLGVDLSYQGFAQELENLPGYFAPPSGRLLLAFEGAEPIGCVALRSLGDGVCEMKRLFIRERHQRRGIGRVLAERMISEARDSGYSRMVLDTLSHMSSAIRLYERLGFTRCSAYYATPLANTVFFERHLQIRMKIVNTNQLPEHSWSSPKGKFGGSGKEVSEALGRDPFSTDLRKRHPFDVEILRVPPGKHAYPYHSHSAQWEFYHVISGNGLVRHADGTTPIGPGDAFIFEPDQPHQLINKSDGDLVIYVVADNPMGESCHYPDSGKWLIRSPERRLIRSDALEYYDGEE